MRLAKDGAMALALGFICTTIVAWSSALVVPMSTAFANKARSFAVYPVNAPIVEGEKIGWICYVYRHPTGTVARVEFRASNIGPATRIEPENLLPIWSIARGPVPESILARAPLTKSTIPRPTLAYLEDARGWPLPAWFCRFGRTAQGTASVEHGISLGGTQHQQIGPVPYAIPIAPLPMGLLVDTAIFGAAIFLARGVRVEFSRASRLLAVTCPECHHSVRGTESALCPECGSPCRLSDYPTAAVCAQVLGLLDRPTVRAALLLAVTIALAVVGWSIDPTRGGEAGAVLAIAALPALAAALGLAGLGAGRSAQPRLARMLAGAALLLIAAQAAVGAMMLNTFQLGEGAPLWMQCGGVLCVTGSPAVLLACWVFQRSRPSDQRWSRVVTIFGCESAGMLGMALMTLLFYCSYRDVEELKHSLLLAPGGALWAGLLAAWFWRSRPLPVLQ